MHDLGFAHRDLKPDNVLLYLIEGRVAHLTISDFSAAIECAVGESLTVFPNHIGGASVEGDRTTIDYCCPEMVGTKSNQVYAVDPASMDVWSLGAVLAVVGLRGEPFILGSDPQRTLRDIALRLARRPYVARGTHGARTVPHRKRPQTRHAPHGSNKSENQKEKTTRAPFSFYVFYFKFPAGSLFVVLSLSPVPFLSNLAVVLVLV